MQKAGVDVFVVHARNAILQGLTPKENREIPPLRYDWVYRLKQERPDLRIVLNGGLLDVAQCQQALAHVDGVMMGRAAYQEPWRLLAVDAELFGETPPQATMMDVDEQGNIVGVG